MRLSPPEKLNWAYCGNRQGCNLHLRGGVLNWARGFPSLKREFPRCNIKARVIHRFVSQTLAAGAVAVFTINSKYF